MIRFIDTHAHLNDEKFADNLSEVIERAKAAGIANIINMGDTPESSAKVCGMADGEEMFFAAVGVHPEETEPLDAAALDGLAELASGSKVVAVGEIGLDYYWEKDAERRLKQQRLFRQQLDLAKNLNLPVCIHDREAHGDTLKILREDGRGLTGVFHCFSGSYETAREVFRLDFMIGADGPLTFKNAAKLPEIVAKCPRDYLLLETDAPYMAPVPKRGKTNEPSFLPHIAAKVAELWNVTLEEVARRTTANALNLYTKLKRDEK